VVLNLTHVAYGDGHFPAVSPEWTRKAGYKPARRTLDSSEAAQDAAVHSEHR